MSKGCGHFIRSLPLQLPHYLTFSHRNQSIHDQVSSKTVYVILDLLYLFIKVVRSRCTEGTGRVEGAVLRTDTLSIRPGFIPDFSKGDKIRRFEMGFIEDVSKMIAFCGSKTQL